MFAGNLTQRTPHVHFEKRAILPGWDRDGQDNRSKLKLENKLRIRLHLPNLAFIASSEDIVAMYSRLPLSIFLPRSCSRDGRLSVFEIAGICWCWYSDTQFVWATQD